MSSLCLFANLLLIIGSGVVSGFPQQPSSGSEVLGSSANNRCGGFFSDVAANSGTIDYWVSNEDAGYPEKTCVWVIIESSLTQGFEVKITDLELPQNNKNCTNGKVSITSFVHDNGSTLESHVFCEATNDFIPVNGNAMAIIFKTNKAVIDHGLRLEWRQSGEYLEIQKLVKAETSFNKPDNLAWPGYDIGRTGIGQMGIYAFPKGNLSDVNHEMKAVFEDIIFTQPSTICTDEFLMINAIEDGALKLLDTICDNHSGGSLGYESSGGFVFFVSTNFRNRVMYSNMFQVTYWTRQKKPEALNFKLESLNRLP